MCEDDDGVLCSEAGPPGVLDLIAENLRDGQARHLLLITRGDHAIGAACLPPPTPGASEPAPAPQNPTCDGGPLKGRDPKSAYT